LQTPIGEDFLKESYGHSWRLFKGSFSSTASMVGWADINVILSNHWHDPETVRLVQDGRPVLLREYAERRRWRGKLNLADFYAVLRRGASLVIEDVASWHPLLCGLVLMFEQVLRESVQTQLFINGCSSKGFGIHWDPYDVFAVQLLGRRTWSIYRPTREAPLLVDKEAPSMEEREFIGNVELLEGDALYLPRGWWHDAGGALEPSAHLTIVVPKRTGISFLSWIVDEVRSDVVARIDIPRFSDDSQLQDYAVDLRETVARIITTENIKKYLNEHDQNADAKAIFGLPWILGQRPAFPADLRVINMVPRAQVDMLDDHVIVLADTRRFVFDRSAFGALNYVFAVTETDLDALALVSDLPQDDLLALLDELQDNGLVASVVNANGKLRPEHPGGES
jgi:ribosomal protein L16 Arg81 hydroxylase